MSELLANLGPIVAAGVIYTLIGSAILRAACALYNRIVQRINRSMMVPDLDTNKAVITSLVAIIVLIGTFLGLEALGAKANLGEITARVLGVAFSFLATAGMVTVLLPTKFVRGILIAAIQYVIAFAILLALAIAISILTGRRVPLLS
jgi:hypothetical protein